VPEGGEFVVLVAGGTIWGASVLSFFKARSALFRQSLVNTHPPTFLAVVLQFCRCLLRPKISPLTGTWSSRARGFVTPWAARDDHVSVSVAVLGGVRGFWCSVTAGDTPVVGVLIVKSKIPMIKFKSHEDLRTKFHFSFFNLL
jgi:hypothetical protein